MKNNMLKDLLVVGSVAATLLFVQPMQGQNKEALNVSANSALSLLAEEDISATPAKYAPTMDMATETDACFDLTQVGVLDKIRCFDYDLGYDNTTGFYGWDAALSAAGHPRHKLMTTGTDDLVSALKATTPSGGNSILLATDGYTTGQWAKGALMVYYYTVDANHPIVTIEYAAVLEKGGHTIAKTSGFEQYAQPWISIYAAVGDAYVECIDYTFTPLTGTTGWKSVASDSKGRPAIWQDWTSVTFDLSKYVGKRVMFAYEVHDCAEEAYNFTTEQITLCSDHELAHLYTSMSCAEKKITQTCTEESITLTAPAGFKYKWYENSKPAVSLGTTQSITVSNKTKAQYSCVLTDGCGTSTISTQVYSNEYSHQEILVTGQTYDFHGKILSKEGVYRDTMKGQGYLGCDSIEILTLIVNSITQECSGNSVTMIAPSGFASYQWMNSQKENILGATSQRYAVSLQSDASERFICHMEDGKGGIVELDAMVHSNTHTFTHVINEGEEFDFFGRKLKTKGSYTHTIPGGSYLGCDSIIVLDLVVKTAATDKCFDMTDIENVNINLKNSDFGTVGKTPDLKDILGWKPFTTSPSSHPRQTMITRQGNDNLIPQLKMIPANKETSFKLASDPYQPKDSAKGSKLEFSYTIDPENPIVLLQYACVLEKSQHNVSLSYPEFANPWIRICLQIGAATDVLFDHNPSNVNSVSGTKWHDVASDANGNGAYWKDWEVIGMDLSNYAGQTVILHLEQHDCAVVSDNNPIQLCAKQHKSVLYTYLDCTAKKIIQTCDNNGITLTAPEGFQYQWYKNNAKIAGATSQTYVVSYLDSDQKATFKCELINLIPGAGTKEVETVVYSNKHSYSRTIEYGQTYDFYGEKLSAPDTYTKVVPGKPTYLGCDSIEVLTLSVKEGCEGTAKMQQDTLCGDAENMTVMLNYTMGSPKNYQLKFSEEAKTAGFEDVTTPIDLQGETKIVIPFRHQPNAKMVDGKDYPRPGNYQVTITEGTSCGNSLTHTLNFTILYPSSIIVQRWNDVLAITNSTYNGGYNFSRIRWYHEGQEIAGNGEHNSYYYVKGDDSQTLAMGTEYWAELTREGESTGICTCHLIPQTTQNVGTKFAGVQLVASRDGSRHLEFVTEESGVYSLYDVCGRVIQSSYFGQEYGVMDIDLTATLGNIFILKFVTNSGQQDSKKLMIY